MGSEATVKKKIKPGAIEVHPEDAALVVNYEVRCKHKGVPSVWCTKVHQALSSLFRDLFVPCSPHASCHIGATIHPAGPGSCHPRRWHARGCGQREGAQKVGARSCHFFCTHPTSFQWMDNLLHCSLVEAYMTCSSLLHFFRRIPVKGLNASSDTAAVAQDVVDKCKLIHPSKVRRTPAPSHPLPSSKQTGSRHASPETACVRVCVTVRTCLPCWQVQQ